MIGTIWSIIIGAILSIVIVGAFFTQKLFVLKDEKQEDYVVKNRKLIKKVQIQYYFLASIVFVVFILFSIIF